MSIGLPIAYTPTKTSADIASSTKTQRTTSVPMGGDKHTVFRVGEVHGRSTPRVEALAGMVAGIDSVKVTSNLWGERWSKLCVNAMRNGISAATGLSGNECDRNEATRRLAIRIGGEAVRVGQALGYALEPIQNIDPECLARAGEGDRAALEEAEAVLLAGSNSSGRSDLQRPSMGQDMMKGRRTEIDFINGFIADEAAKIGRAAPANAALTAMVKRVERGEVPARPENAAGL